MGRAAGAAYFPAEFTVPKEALPPETPLTDHVTAVFEVPVTVTLNCCVLPMRTLAVEGDTET